MSNEIAAAKDFQTRMFERIRDQMGDLMTDEELKKVVDAAMQKAFFDERIARDTYGRETGRKPSLIVEMVGELMQPEIRASVNVWLQENPDAVTKAIQAALSGGITWIVQNEMNRRAQGPLNDLQQRLVDAGIFS